jgi:hypothetical protein
MFISILMDNPTTENAIRTKTIQTSENNTAKALAIA